MSYSLEGREKYGASNESKTVYVNGDCLRVVGGRECKTAAMPLENEIAVTYNTRSSLCRRFQSYEMALLIDL